MAFSIRILAPSNGTHFDVGAHYQVTGVIQWVGGGDPPAYSTVSVAGPGINKPAQLQSHGGFTASGNTPTQGQFQIQAHFTDDEGKKHTSPIVSIVVGLVYTPQSPSIILDVAPMAFFEAAYPDTVAPIQRALLKLAGQLGRFVFVGPNHMTRPLMPDAAGSERIAFWLLDPTAVEAGAPRRFPLVPVNSPIKGAKPGTVLLLPILSDDAVTATLSAPFFPPDTVAPGAPPTFSFSLMISATFLQTVATALLPSLTRTAKQASAFVDSLGSISVTCTAPNLVVAEIVGSAAASPFTLTVTETLALAPLAPGSTTMLPSVTGRADFHNFVALDANEIIAAILDPLADLAVVGIGGAVVKGVNASVADAIGLANMMVGNIPVIIALPAGSLGDGTPFPGLALAWSTLGASAAGIAGTGTVTTRSRTNADVMVTITGPAQLTYSPSDGAGAPAALRVTWKGILPDAAKFNAQITGAMNEVVPIPIPSGEGDIGVGSTLFGVTFPSLKPGQHAHFQIVVTATETNPKDGAIISGQSAPFAVTVIGIRHVIEKGTGTNIPGGSGSSGGHGKGHGGGTPDDDAQGSNTPAGGHPR